MLLYGIIVAAAAIGLLEGSEIALFSVAASSSYGWKKAWLVTLAGLLTLMPLLVVFYFFFKAIPFNLATIAAGIIILALGAHFFQEGFDGRKEKGGFKEEEEEKSKAGMIGIYGAIVLEGAEAGGISMSIGTAGGSYASAIIGMAIGLLIPLLTIKVLAPLLEKVPEWIVQMTVGSVMMVAAVAIIIFGV